MGFLEEIDIAGLHVGPKGGRPTAKLTLRSAVAVRGPLLLGRNSHCGGGLFHAVRRPWLRNPIRQPEPG